MKIEQASKSYLLAALSRVVDEPLQSKGFNRSAKSISYQRQSKDSQQEIAFVTDWKPRYQPGVDAHLHPMLRLKMPAISARAVRLVKGDLTLLAGAPEIILNQPIEWAAPKDQQSRWFATGAIEFIEICESIAAYLLRWAVPLLDSLSTIEGLVQAYEDRDSRVLMQRHWYVYVIAAYLELGRVDDAREVVARHFGGTGARMRYEAVFEMVEL
jgi:hypothetical protein